jgi:DNA-binding NtrC family response regulator
MFRPIERALVIEDDAALRAAIVRILAGWGDVAISEAGTAASARILLAQELPPDLVIIDVRLPDESAFGVLEIVSQLSPVPIIVAMSGKASPAEAFRLGQLGVRRYLRKPFSIQELTDAVEAARNAAPDIEPVISAWVGRVPMRELQREVRRVMVKEALALEQGSRSGAARLLHVTRQAVQQMLRSESSHEASGPPPPKGPAS